jgi:DEAD/DEAH box helicase domain-containing protein
MATHTGIVDWYSSEGYGVIRDDAGVEYAIQRSHLAPAAHPLQKGQVVAFDSRPGRQRRHKPEAFNVVVQTAPAMLEQPLETAAAEILRFRREQRIGEKRETFDPLAKGAEIHHPAYGMGRVVFATKMTIVVEFESGDLHSLERGGLAAMLATPAPPAAPTPLPPAERATPFSRFMEQLRRDTLVGLAREGVDTEGVYRLEEAVEAAQQTPIEALDARVRDAFAREGIEHFYTHQVEAYHALRGDKSVVLCTPTASGKTASFTPAILERLICQPGQTALYVFPLVALAADQTGKLLALNAHLPAADRLRIGVLNSSVDREQKWETQRSENDIIITTPDTLHYQLLPNAFNNWETFFRNLRFIVLDEAHVYKGAFGANVANIVRRVVARCYRLSGRAPQIVVSSATVRDPQALAVKLTGYRAGAFAMVNRNGARKPQRHFLITRESAQDICADLLTVNTTDALTGERRPVRVMVFSKSIQGAKTGCARLRAHLSRSGRGELASRIADFYSDKSDKNDTFARLRNGDIQCIFTTTALMAGIDIGSLDVVIVDGFPGLVMDARQMFGRGGRAGEGAAIFIAHRGDPFDDFYLDNPDLLFSGETEPVIVNPENPLLLSAHLLCAAKTSADRKSNEGPLDARIVSRLFGDAAQAAMGAFEAAGKIEYHNGAICCTQGCPHDEWPLNDLRAGNDRDPLVLQTREGRTLEKKRRALALRDTHPDAVFLYDGKKYRVTRFPRREDATNVIECEPVAGDDGVWTQGVEQFDIAVTRALSPARESGCFSRALGEARVQTTVEAYRRYHTRNVARCVSRNCRHESPNLDLRQCPRCHSPMRQRQMDEPDSAPIPITGDYDLTTLLDTQAAWIDFRPDLPAAYEAMFWPRWRLPEAGAASPAHPAFACGVASAASALLKAFPECANCDRDDIAALSLPAGSAWRIYVYDNFPRGLGLAAEFVHEPLPYLHAALDYLERCSCGDEGCPVCLHNFRSRQLAMMSKLAARFVLRSMLGLDMAELMEDLDAHISLLPPAATVYKPAMQA